MREQDNSRYKDVVLKNFAFRPFALCSQGKPPPPPATGVCGGGGGSG